MWNQDICVLMGTSRACLDNNVKDNEEDTHIHRYTHLYFVDDLKFTPLYIREKYK